VGSGGVYDGCAICAGVAWHYAEFSLFQQRSVEPEGRPECRQEATRVGKGRRARSKLRDKVEQYGAGPKG
jgi:hypothetical protein